MNISSSLDQLHFKVKQNRWMRYFAIFNRVALAAGFLPAGWVKIIGERFTDLHNDQPTCEDFCDCIHNQGQPLDKCLEQYNKAVEATNHKQ